MRSVVLLTGAHLCHNPRVQKEAAALARHGFDVEVLGAWFDAELKERDRALTARADFRFTPVADFTERRAGPIAIRARRRMAGTAFRRLGIATRWQLGYCVDELAREAARRPCDLAIAHSEAALPAARALLAQGRRAGIDMEDWFSEDLTPTARRGRPVALLKSLESHLLRHAAHATCPSHAMASALAATYGCAEPAVVYNAFERDAADAANDGSRDRTDRTHPSIHWVSQTLGPDRGLEDLFAALPLLRHLAEVHLRGQEPPGTRAWLDRVVPRSWKARVHVHGLVANDALLARIDEHDIGFAGERPYCANKDLTVSNKILHYLLAGLAVAASATWGHREVAEQAPGAVGLYPPGDAPALAALLDGLLGARERLAAAKRAASEAAAGAFAWERQEERLLQAVERGLGR
jgi:glycosyltransferase involved in cell wall biosynthesis